MSKLQDQFNILLSERRNQNSIVKRIANYTSSPLACDHCCSRMKWLSVLESQHMLCAQSVGSTMSLCHLCTDFFLQLKPDEKGGTYQTPL